MLRFFAITNLTMLSLFSNIHAQVPVAVYDPISNTTMVRYLAQYVRTQRTHHRRVGNVRIDRPFLRCYAGIPLCRGEFPLQIGKIPLNNRNIRF